MKGDFSRGHQPDQKRGKTYRRVLLQEGRLVTDSDVAAGVDAFDALVRHVAADLGCETGSPDLGYLLTPGPLFALFETLVGVSPLAPAGVFQTYRDYGKKYKERFPSIYINATALAGFVTVEGRHRIQKADYSKLHVWAILPAGEKIEIKVNGAQFLSTAHTGSGLFEPLLVDLAAMPGTEYDTIDMGFSLAGPTHEGWVAMVEGVETAGTRPKFWATGGRYYAKGLDVTLTPDGSDGAYSEVTFPAAAGFGPAPYNPPAANLVLGQSYVGYLEAWERLISRVEDRGILEQALGGLDTTVRSRAYGQVKIALFTGATDGDKVVGAFANVNRGAAELEVTTSPKVDDPDPCALPVEGGYTGPDNRLYRFEVHAGGNLGAAQIKWSKNNGADLWEAVVEDAPNGEISLRGANDVSDGDLVELTNETSDLGDADLGGVDTASPSFHPPKRNVGTLYYVKSASTTGHVILLNRLTKVAAPLDPALFDSLPGEPKKIAKIRRWHGLLDTAGPMTSFAIGDGVEVKLGGADFREGDYWQFEARRLKDNANGPWNKSPHGPERVFAPLALFTYQGAGSPVLLDRWYDHQFSAICELNADDIAYDGGKSGTSADTVQEAIDELYSKVDEGGCCDVHLEPSKTVVDDAARIQDAIDNKLPTAGGTICLKTGVYHFKSTVTVDGKRVVIVGCPSATCVRDNTLAGPMFGVEEKSALGLKNLILWAPTGAADVISLKGGTTFGEESFLDVRDTSIVGLHPDVIAIHAGGVDPIPPLPTVTDPWEVAFTPDGISTVRVRDSIVVAAWALATRAMFDSLVERSFFFAGKGSLFAEIGFLFDVIGSRFLGALEAPERATLAALDVNALAGPLATLFENVALTKDAVPGTYGWVLGEWQLGHVRENIVLAGRPCRFAELKEMRFSNNLYRAMDGSGVRADRAFDTQFVGESWNVEEGIGLHVPWLITDLRVERCRIEAQVGVLLSAAEGGKPIGSNDGPYVDGLRIQGCDLSAGSSTGAPTIGILIGPDLFEDPSFSALRRVVIADNDLAHFHFGIAVTVTEGSNPLDRGLRIASNRISDVRINGILTEGGGIEIAENTIQGAQGETCHGIWLYDPSSTHVHHNRVDLASVPSEDVTPGGIVAGPRLFFLTQGLSIHGNTVQNRAVNVDGTPEGFIPLYIAAAGAKQAYVASVSISDNLFAIGTSGLINLFDVALHGNRFYGLDGALTILQCVDVRVNDNEMVGSESDAASFIGFSANGRWQVENNRVYGRLLLFPTSQILSDFSSGAFVQSGAVEASKISPLIEELIGASHKAMAAAKEAKSAADAKAGGGADGVVIGAKLAAWTSKTKAAFADLKKVLVAEPAPEAAKDEASQLVGAAIFDMLTMAAFDVFFFFVEAPFHALVSGNWSTGDFVVGNPDEQITTGTTTYFAGVSHPDSVVQIIGNRSEAWMIANSYDHFVALGNAAVQTYGINATAFPQDLHNILT